MAAVAPAESREKRMSRAFSTATSQSSVLHKEEMKKCCCGRLNVKNGSFLFLLLDCAVALMLFAAIIIHITVQQNRSLIFILSIAVFCIGTALSAVFYWLALRTEKAAYLWVFIGSTIVSVVQIFGLGNMILLENTHLTQTDVFKASFLGFQDSMLSGSKLVTLAIAAITGALVAFLLWKLSVLIKFYYYLFENSADGRIRHVRNDTRLHRRRKSTPYYDRRSSMFPELEEDNKKNENDSAA